MQRSLGVELTYEIIKLNHDGLLLSKLDTLSSLLRDWSLFWEIASKIQSKLERPLARLEKMSTPELLAVMLTVAGITGVNGINPEARIDVAGLGKFADLCLSNQTCIEETLGQPVRRDVARNPVRQLNMFLKLGGLKLDPLIRKKRQQKSLRLYGFEINYFDAMMMLAAKFQSPDAIQERLRALRD